MSFFTSASWAIIFILLALVLLKVYAGLNHEIHPGVGCWGKWGTILIVLAQIYTVVMNLIYTFVGSDSNPYFVLWLGSMVTFTGLLFIQISIFMAVNSGGHGIGEQSWNG